MPVNYTLILWWPIKHVTGEGQLACHHAEAGDWGGLLQGRCSLPQSCHVLCCVALRRHQLPSSAAPRPARVSYWRRPTYMIVVVSYWRRPTCILLTKTYLCHTYENLLVSYWRRPTCINNAKFTNFNSNN